MSVMTIIFAVVCAVVVCMSAVKYGPEWVRNGGIRRFCRWVVNELHETIAELRIVFW